MAGYWLTVAWFISGIVGLWIAVLADDNDGIPPKDAAIVFIVFGGFITFFLSICSVVVVLYAHAKEGKNP